MLKHINIVLGLKKGSLGQGIVKSRGGFISKIHAATDENGKAMCVFITGGNIYDSTQAEKLLHDTIHEGVALYSETLAGKISSEVHPQTKTGSAKEAEIAANYLAEIAVLNGKVYLTDPVNDVLWCIE